MASCTTIYGSDSVITQFNTVTQTSYYTNDGSAYTTSSPSQIVTCATPTGNSTSGDSVCSTSTSYVVQTISGAASTGSYLVTATETQLSTSYGSASTSCAATTSSSSSSSSHSEYIPPTTSSTFSTSSTSTTTQAVVVAPTSATSSQPLTSTSFSTVFVTSVDNNGRTSVLAIPTLLNSGSSKAASSKTNAGAIGGGVVGGVVALLAAVGFLWFLKKKGVFSRDTDEHFGDDMWQPSAHSPDGGPEYAGDRGSGEGSGGMMSEKDHGSYPELAGRQSWYGGEMAAADRATSPGGVEGYSNRATTPGGVDGYNDVGSADGHQMPPAAYQRESRASDYGGDMGAAAGYGQRLSHRQSQSGSSQGHEIPNPRLSGMNFYQPNMYENDDRRESLLHRANSGSLASDHSDSRTAATTGSSVAYPMPSSKRLMANLGDAPSMPRPPLHIIPSGNSDLTNSSGAESSLFSSTSAPSTAASSVGKQRTMSGEIKKIQELKGRPSFARHDSDDSLLVPSQFLGARVANITPGEEKAEQDWNAVRA